jgi:hypothetical protein
MSRVTNYILIFGSENGESSVDAVNASLNATGGARQNFLRVDRHAGGYKAIEANVYMLAGNYLPIETVARAIRDADWFNRETVQLVWRDQEDDVFRLCSMADLEAL